MSFSGNWCNSSLFCVPRPAIQQPEILYICRDLWAGAFLMRHGYCIDHCSKRFCPFFCSWSCWPCSQRAFCCPSFLIPGALGDTGWRFGGGTFLPQHCQTFFRLVEILAFFLVICYMCHLFSWSKFDCFEKSHAAGNPCNGGKATWKHLIECPLPWSQKPVAFFLCDFTKKSLLKDVIDP